MAAFQASESLPPKGGMLLVSHSWPIGRRVSHTKGQVDHRSAGTLLGEDVLDSPVEALKSGRSSARSVLEDLDGDNLGLFKFVQHRAPRSI